MKEFTCHLIYTSGEGINNGVISGTISVTPLQGYNSLRSLIDCHSLHNYVLQAGIGDGMCVAVISAPSAVKQLNHSHFCPFSTSILT
jgi:hypothetical protein